MCPVRGDLVVLVHSPLVGASTWSLVAKELRAAALEARRRGWSGRRIRGGHFHMLVAPATVAQAILAARA